MIGRLHEWLMEMWWSLCDAIDPANVKYDDDDA